MATVSAQEYQPAFSELECLKKKFLALEQENHRLLGHPQQISLANQQTQQQHGELVLRVQQLEETSTQGIYKEPKIGLPIKFDGMRS